MAKGNMFQGMARGKVGDVVFSRLNGEQISRVRNRHPRNPRTNAQLYQRAIMATILQAYAAGKVVFNHSFEGKSVGEDNMREFMSRNLKMLRAVVASEVATRVAITEEKGRLVGPSSISPVPVPGLIVSQGTVKQTFFKITSASVAANATIARPAAGAQGQTAAEYAAENGLYAGDIYTFIMFLNDFSDVRFKLSTSNSPYATQYLAQFGFLRLTVKDEINEVTAANATLNDIFNIEVDGEVFTTDVATQKVVGEAWEFGELLDLPNIQGTFAIIRSREDSGVRSTETMEPIADENEYGLASWFVLEAWQAGTAELGSSELLLEGGAAGESANGNSQSTEGGNSSGNNQGGSTAPPDSSGY